MYLQEVAFWFYHLAIVLLNSLIVRDKQEQDCFTSGDKLRAEAQCKQCPRWAVLSQKGSERSRQSQLATMTHWQSHTSQRDQSRLGSIQEDQSGTAGDGGRDKMGWQGWNTDPSSIWERGLETLQNSSDKNWKPRSAVKWSSWAPG